MPVYHWTDSRVRGHVMVCFLALVLETAMQKKLQNAGSKASYRQLCKDLTQLYAMKISLEGQDYLTRNELQGEAFSAFKALKMRPPLHMQSLDA